MKRFVCLLMCLLMLGSTCALAAAPKVEYELPVEVDYGTESPSWLYIKHNGSDYTWTSVWEENGEYKYDNSGSKSGDEELHTNFYEYTNQAEWYLKNPGKALPWLVYLSGDDFDNIAIDFFGTYYDEETRQYVRLTEDGGTHLSELLELIRDENGNIIVREKIEVDYMKNNIRSFGPRFTDVDDELTDKWYRFTALDLSEDGTQCYYLISGDYYIVGEVQVTVKGDSVKVTYHYYDENTWDWKDYKFYTFFTDFDSVTTVEPKEIENKFEYGVEYSIANDLGGDTSVLLYMCNKATHTSNEDGLWVFRDQYAPFAHLINAMLEMIGKSAE